MKCTFACLIYCCGLVLLLISMKISSGHLADYVKKLCLCSTIILPYSTNQIVDLWRCRCRSRRRFLSSLLRSLRSTTRLQRRRHQICILNWQKQILHALHVLFCNSLHFFQVLGKSATWNDHFSSFSENVNTQIWIFFSSVDTAPLNSVPV